MKSIYEPKGRAKEYGDYALNIYSGCNHRCTYCYAPAVLRKKPEEFANVKPRPGIVEATIKQLSSGKYEGKTIFLCFTCDPYPAEIDTTPTREIIKAIKAVGAHVMILTKGGSRALRDFDLLDSEDWFGVTYTGYQGEAFFASVENEPNAAPPIGRLRSLSIAKQQGINTWVSMEPVFCPTDIYTMIELADYIDLFKIGKLNHKPSDIDWGEFGRRCERLCKANKRHYYIKQDLRDCMTEN